MKQRKVTKLWGISLLVISICSLILSISSMIEVELPDVLKIVIGILDIIALPILVYTTVKKFREE